MFSKKLILTTITFSFLTLLSFGQTDVDLIQLIYDENYEEAKELIKNKKFINQRDEEGGTPFMWAVYKNQLDIAKLLKKNGAKIYTKGILYDDIYDLAVGSPLTAAALNGDLEMVKFLVLNCGIPANDREIGSNGKLAWNSLFYLAYRKDFKEIAEFLIKKGAPVNLKDSDKKTPLTYAFSQENVGYIDYLLDKNATSVYIDAQGRTPATFAISCNQSKTAKKLLKDNKGLMNKSDKALANPLIVSILKEDEAMVKWLLENGADKKIPLKFISLIFNEAEYQEIYGVHELMRKYILDGDLTNEKLISSDTIKKIIKQTIKPDFFKMLLHNKFIPASNGDGFYTSNKYRYITQLNQKVRILEENNIKIDVDSIITYPFFKESLKNKKFNSKVFEYITKNTKVDSIFYYEMLRSAIYKNNFLAFNAVLEKKINLNPKNVYENSNFLWMAYKADNIKMFNKLIENGANLEYKFKNDETLLHRIISHGKPQNCYDTFFLETLLERGANINAKDIDGNSPLHLSKKPCYDKLLIAYGADINIKNYKNIRASDDLFSYYNDTFIFSETKQKQALTDLFTSTLKTFFSGNIRNFVPVLNNILNKGINLKDKKTLEKINDTIISLAKSSAHFNYFNRLDRILKEHEKTYVSPDYSSILIDKLSKTTNISNSLKKVTVENNLTKFKTLLQWNDLSNAKHNQDIYLTLLTIAAQANSTDIVEYILKQGINPINRKIIPYSNPSYDKLDVFQTIVDSKNIKALKYILAQDSDTNSFDMIDNYIIICDLKNEDFVIEYLEHYLKKEPRYLNSFKKDGDYIYKLNYGAVKNNLWGVIKYLEEKEIPLEKAITTTTGRSGNGHKLNSILILEEKTDFIKFYLEKASEKESYALVNSYGKFILKNNKTKLIDLFLPYIIKDKEMLNGYYSSAITYDNTYAMDAMLKLHPKEKSNTLKKHIKHAIVTRNYNFISSYYSNGFDMSIKLYQRGKNTAGKGDSGMIEYAIDENIPDMVQFLIECDVTLNDPANNSNSPIEYAVDTYDSELIKTILNTEIDSNLICKHYFEPYIHLYDEPWTHIILNRGFYAGFEEFWKKGVNPNIKDKYGNNLLHTMVYNDYDFTINTPSILDKVLNINDKNSYGETALFLACKSGNIKLVKALISKNANTNISNNKNITPLMLAAFTNNKKLIEILMNTNADNKNIDYKNRNALNYAKMGNANDTIIQLLEQY